MIQMSLTALNGAGSYPAKPAMPRGLNSIDTRARIVAIVRSSSFAIRASITGTSAAKAATKRPLGVGPSLSPPAPPAKPAGSSETSV